MTVLEPWVDQWLDRRHAPLHTLHLRPRTYNALMRAGVTTIGAACLLAAVPESLEAVGNLGRTGRSELRRALGVPVGGNAGPAEDHPGARLMTLRRQAHLSRQEMAARLDVSVGCVAGLERGTTAVPLSLLQAYAGLLGQRLQWEVCEAPPADA